MIFNFFKNPQKVNSANAAKERLQVIIARQSTTLEPDLLNKIQLEVLAVLKKYIPVDEKNINLNVQNENDTEVLELNVTFDRV